MNFFFGFLTSRRLVTILLLVFILLMVLGTWIPQEHLSSSFEVTAWRDNHPLAAKIALAVGETRLFTSFPFLMVSSLLLLSTILCTFQRFGQLRSGPSFPLEADSPSEESLADFEDHDGAVVEFVRAQLSKRGYRAKPLPPSAAVVHLVNKGNAGRWGSILFHLSFLILVVGALASVWTRSESSFVLTEGQTFRGHAGEFLSRSPAVLAWEGIDSLDLTLQRFVPEFGELPTYTSELVFREAGAEVARREIRTFQSGAYGGRTFYLEDHGFSPRFVVQAANGSVLFDGFVALASHVSETEVRYEDVFAVPVAGLKIEGQLFPDAEQKAGHWRSLSPRPTRPVFLARIEQGGRPVFDGPISLGETVTLDGLQVDFAELRYWSGLQMVTDFGVPILYTGFLLGCFGLALRTFFSDEYLWLKQVESSSGTELILCGTAERDQALFAEKFRVLAKELQSDVRKMKGEASGE